MSLVRFGKSGEDISFLPSRRNVVAEPLTLCFIKGRNQNASELASTGQELPCRIMHRFVDLMHLEIGARCHPPHLLRQM